jgi:ABC-type uncharacterized transport system permease subunit
MSRKDKSLDEQIAEVEARLSRRRTELRFMAAEARSRMSATKAIPVAVVAALAVGFAASRFVRKPARPAPVDRRSRPTRMIGALAGIMLPPLMRPLQPAAAQWVAERMQHRAGAR